MGVGAPGSIVVRPLSAREAREASPALADVLLDVVEGGASIGFMAPLGRQKALAFWQRIADGVAAGDRMLFAAYDGEGALIGTAQLVLAMPDNQPHRADVSKVLVQRHARGRGAGAALMRAVDEAALAKDKTLLVLDTASAEAERLYEREGWQRVGVVPGFALYPDGTPCDTTYYYKRLPGAGTAVD